MRYLPLALLLVACIDLPTGLNDFFDELAVAGEVANVNCPASMVVGQAALCTVSNNALTQIELGGFVLAIWESSAPTIVSVSTDGEVTALAVGTATITARGTNNSTGSTVITVT